MNQRNVTIASLLFGGVTTVSILVLSWALNKYSENAVPKPVAATAWSSALKQTDKSKFQFSSPRLRELFQRLDRRGSEQFAEAWNYSEYRIANSTIFRAPFPETNRIPTEIELDSRETLIPNLIHRLDYRNKSRSPNSEMAADVEFYSDDVLQVKGLRVQFKLGGIDLLLLPSFYVSGVYCDQYEFRYHLPVDVPKSSLLDSSCFESASGFRTYLLELQESLEGKVIELHNRRELISRPIYKVECSGGAGEEPPRVEFVPESAHLEVYDLALENLARQRILIEQHYEAMHAALIAAMPEWKIFLHP
jgi:hypothetical protein